MSAAKSTLTGVWAVFVLSGGHRVIGCLDKDADVKTAEKFLAEQDGYLQLVESYELTIIPTPKGLAPCVYAYSMLPDSVAMVRTENIQTMAFFHQLGEKGRVAFERYVADARRSNAALSAGLAGLSLA